MLLVEGETLELVLDGGAVVQTWREKYADDGLDKL
jgi:hypothetical protein